MKGMGVLGHGPHQAEDRIVSLRAGAHPRTGLSIPESPGSELRQGEQRHPHFSLGCLNPEGRLLLNSSV